MLLMAEQSFLFIFAEVLKVYKVQEIHRPDLS